MFCERNKTGRAFTLVELLVVIGIIALLVSILLPVLGSARRQANATRCATQLREIGAALQYYANDNKGWLPPVIHQHTGTFAPTATQMSQGADRSLATSGAAARTDYWYMFLLKYFTKGEYRNAVGSRLGDFQRTPLWGCPEVDKTALQTSVSSADFDSGYGMSPYHAFRADDAAWATRNAGGWSALVWQNIGVFGRYYKLTDIHRPAEKAIAGDSKSWFLEVRWFAGNTVNSIQPQQLGRVGAQSSDQSYFDRYRHGKYPPSNGTTYSLRGGKQAFNMVFADGHVETLDDVKKGFKAVRSRWPN